MNQLILINYNNRPCFINPHLLSRVYIHQTNKILTIILLKMLFCFNYSYNPLWSQTLAIS